MHLQVCHDFAVRALIALDLFTRAHIEERDLARLMPSHDQV
jgi:hypothetical protein